MKRTLVLGLAVSCLVLSPLGIAHGVSQGDPAAQLAARFAKPPAEYSSAPLWVWNDQMTDQMVLGTLRDLAAQHVRQAFVHPRPGLMTPYLSPEWFRLWRVALVEAQRLGVRLWIYDENSYPSGFAGGYVPEAMPESRGRGLVFREGPLESAWTGDTLAVFQLDEKGYQDVSVAARRAAAPVSRLGLEKSDAPGKYLAVAVASAEPSPWYGGKVYVDLLRPGVTEKFLEITLGAYKREIGQHFGRMVPGVFTDEPHLRPAGGLPWTPGLPQLFETRWGYALTAHLPALAKPAGDWKRVRHNYYQLLLEQFIERWGRPYYEYCERNRLEFTGHYWEHEWPNCASVPDNMAMAAWQQRPGIDTLMNQYGEGPHSQFGNVRAVKEVSSIANQLGRARTLSEGYGAGGWDLRFEDMKRIGDWLYVLGVNTLDQHLSYASLRGARKRDHPQSFSYHEPWWDDYQVSADYFARLSVAMSAGQQVNDILVIEPTTTAWLYNSPSRPPAPELEALGNAFQQLLVSLERAQVEYDLGSEDVMARHGAVEGHRLRVGQRHYSTVVVPPLTENLNAATVKLLEAFLQAGGVVVAGGPPPDRVEGEASPRAAALAALPGWTPTTAAAIPAALLGRQDHRVVVAAAEGDKGILFHHRRQLGRDQLLLLVNTSLDARAAGTVHAEAGFVEQWDPATGRVSAYPFESTTAGTRIRFELPQAGSLLLRLGEGRRPAPSAVPVKRLAVAPLAAPIVKRDAENVLVLDYLDVRAGGDSRERAYFYTASQFAFQKNGLGRNPWDSAVQFRETFVNRTFPPSSGVEATYRFTVAGTMPPKLTLVVERADLYSITCNGTKVLPVKGEWWLDRSFGRIDITKAARVGENEVVLKASPFTMRHELEPAYVIGDFTLAPRSVGFAITPDQPFGLGPWNARGYPFYADGVSYTQRFPVARPAGTYEVELKRWYGSVARVTVNGKLAGRIVSAPWTLDVTPFVRAGENTVAVTVVGTLKNTLGPHHEQPALGTAWPSMFQKGPSPGPPAGMGYSTVGYGLFDAFALVQVLPAAGR